MDKEYLWDILHAVELILLILSLIVIFELYRDWQFPKICCG